MGERPIITCGQRGLGLLELIAVLAVLAVIGVSLAATMPAMLVSGRVAATRRDMQRLHRAMIGDPDAGNFGFVGDMGRLPRDLTELVERGGNIAYHHDSTYSVGMGWNGPYLSECESGDPAVDAFGTPYALGRHYPGQIQSAGPDGRFDTDDDIYVPAGRVRYRGEVRLELSKPGRFIVRLFYTDDGRERVLEAMEPPYIFDGIHAGVHAVEVWQEREDRSDADLLRRTVVISNGRGEIFRIDLGGEGH